MSETNTRTDAPQQKQDANETSYAARREGYDSKDLGAQSSYDDATETQRRIERGDETKGDPDARDAAGATDARDAEESRNDQDTTPRAGSETAGTRSARRAV